MKPLPYCSDLMLGMLRNIAEGKGRDVPGVRPGPITQAYEALKSRGWVDRAGAVTDAGRAYLATRGPK